MFIVRNLLIWLSAILWIVGLNIVRGHSEWWWIAAIVLCFIFVSVVWLLCRRQSLKTFLRFLILPLAISLCGFALSLFVVNELFFYVLVILTAVVLYLLLKQCDSYFNSPAKYQPYSLENFSLYVCVLVSYFLFAGGFGALILLQLNVWLLLISQLIVIGFCTYQFFWLHKVDFSKSWIFISTTVLIIGELFFAIAYLPIGYYVSAFILMIAYYLILSFSKFSLANNLNARKIATDSLMAVILLLAVLLTAKWN